MRAYAWVIHKYGGQGKRAEGIKIASRLMSRDLPIVTKQILVATDLPPFERPWKLRPLFNHFERHPALQGLEIDTLIQILHRQEAGLRVLYVDRLGLPVPDISLLMSQENKGNKSLQNQAVVIPLDDETASMKAGDRLSCCEIYLVASILRGLNGSVLTELEFAISPLRRYLLRQTLSVTQVAKGDLRDPKSYQDLFPKLIQIARNPLEAGLNNNREASIVIDILEGMESQKIKQILSKGL